MKKWWLSYALAVSHKVTMLKTRLLVKDRVYDDAKELFAGTSILFGCIWAPLWTLTLL